MVINQFIAIWTRKWSSQLGDLPRTTSCPCLDGRPTISQISSSFDEFAKMQKEKDDPGAWDAGLGRVSVPCRVPQGSGSKLRIWWEASKLRQSYAADGECCHVMNQLDDLKHHESMLAVSQATGGPLSCLSHHSAWSQTDKRWGWRQGVPDDLRNHPCWELRSLPAAPIANGTGSAMLDAMVWRIAQDPLGRAKVFPGWAGSTTIRVTPGVPSILTIISFMDKFSNHFIRLMKVHLGCSWQPHPSSLSGHLMWKAGEKLVSTQRLDDALDFLTLRAGSTRWASCSGKMCYKLVKICRCSLIHSILTLYIVIFTATGSYPPAVPI